ncbi:MULTISPECIES: hypothetical protein [Sphingobacterium]|uniref:Uncharacterized protein n=1 Tax=Sphingobacterium tenebrionis TaxID=3111775 RepID=A0ABU8I2Y6_9SPHI|nr:MULTISPECIES: hypothetical protein [unclassified Sphingobacterium]
METKSNFDLTAFIFRHALWFKENYSLQEAENFIKKTLKEDPKEKKKLLLKIRMPTP